MLKQALFFGAVSHCHDVHASKLCTRFPPVAVGENFVPADLGSSLEFHSGRHGPMKQPIESSHADTSGRRLYVFQECRKPSNNLSSIEILGHGEENLQRQIRLCGA